MLTGILVVASGWDGLSHFPQVFIGPSAERAMEERVDVFWPRWAFPVSAPALVMLTVTILTAWMDLALKTDRIVAKMSVVVAMVTVLLPLTFFHQSLTGPAWIRVPHWYWIWTILFGTLCSAWFGYRVVSGYRSSGSLE